MVRKVLPGNLILAWNLNEQRNSYVKIREKSFPDRGNSKSKDPEEEMSLMCSRNKETITLLQIWEREWKWELRQWPDLVGPWRSEYRNLDFMLNAKESLGKMASMWETCFDIHLWGITLTLEWIMGGQLWRQASQLWAINTVLIYRGNLAKFNEAQTSTWKGRSSLTNWQVKMNKLPSNVQLRGSVKEKTYVCGPFH